MMRSMTLRFKGCASDMPKLGRKMGFFFAFSEIGESAEVVSCSCSPVNGISIAQSSAEKRHSALGCEPSLNTVQPKYHSNMKMRRGSPVIFKKNGCPSDANATAQKDLSCNELRSRLLLTSVALSDESTKSALARITRADRQPEP